MSTPRSTALPPGTRRVRDDATGLATLQSQGHGLGTVLLAPGFTGSKEDFLDLIPALAAAGWDVVALDHKGQNESPWASDYSLDAWAQDLCRLAAGCRPPVHVVGHSLGGLIAGTASSCFDWASVTLLNSGSGPVHQSKHDSLRLLISALDQFPMSQIWDVKTAGDRAAGWNPPSAEVESFMRDRFVRTDPASLQEMSRILLADHQQDLSAARGRLFVAFGMQDPDSWSWQTQVDLAARWNAGLAVIPNAAHSPAVEDPDTTAALLIRALLQPGQREVAAAPSNGYCPGVRIMLPAANASRAVADHVWAWGLASLADEAQRLTEKLVESSGSAQEVRLSALADRIRLEVRDASGAEQFAELPTSSL